MIYVGYDTKTGHWNYNENRDILHFGTSTSKHPPPSIIHPSTKTNAQHPFTILIVISITSAQCVFEWWYIQMRAEHSFCVYKRLN